MALGFRKSLFGYNTEDVAEYIHKSSIEHKDVVTALNTNIKNMESDIFQLKSTIDTLNIEKDELNEKLAFYISKYEEVKSLSENIGKLYLVAQTNAKSIMASANSAKEATREQIDENIKTIDAATISLSEVRERFNSLNDEFNASVSQLAVSLDEIKAMVLNSDEIAENSNKEFSQVFRQITK